MPPVEPGTDRRRPGFPRSLGGQPLVLLAALASAGAGAVHVAVAPEHRDWAPSVVFFFALGAFQILWAVGYALRPTSRPLLLVGVAVNVAAFGTWMLSRTVGMPFGPKQGQAETVARTDVIAVLLGLAAAGCALAMARQWHPLGRLAMVKPGLTGAAGGTAVAAAAIVALTGASGHGHAGAEGHGTPGHHVDTTSVVQPASTSTAGAGTACKAARKLAAATAKTAKASTTRIAKQRAAADRCRAASLAVAGVTTRQPAARPKPAAAQAPPHEDDGHQDSH
ncbi:MAG: hypothetical protein ACT4QF_04810 [Sporichthyaceae bacterium]